MNLIIETDLGHDPDDFFAILYLISAGVKICAVNIVPGHPDQIKLAQLIRDYCDVDFAIGASKFDLQKRSVSGVHIDLLEKYYSDRVHLQVDTPDGDGEDIIESTLRRYPDCELFIIGPATSIGRYIKKHPDASFSRATMQGGFCGYHVYIPKITLEKFENQTWVPTFNLNGDRSGGLAFINAKVTDRRFIGKNVCHTIVYNKETHALLKPKDLASELFKEGMDLYLARHEEKKFHDPAAAVAHLHPDVFSWVRGKVQKIEAGWGTVIDEEGDHVAVDVDYHKLWHHIANFN